MLINFNIGMLDELLYNFYRLTGLTISIWDAEFHQLSFQPKEMRSFCRMIKESPEGKQRCFFSDKEICMKCAKTGKPATHYCHAGLLDTAIPIKFKDSIMGYMMFGQIADIAEKDNICLLERLSRELRIDFRQLQGAYGQLDICDQEIIDSAANILKMATRYLWLSEYIEIGYNTIASQIDDYIRTHIREELSVKTLCSVFGISKNRLYEISHEWFKMSIGEYIASVRIKEAKRLLSSTNDPISQISLMVGINDYNYFTKFFKMHVGVVPHRYRKEFPFNLHEKEI